MGVQVLGRIFAAWRIFPENERKHGNVMISEDFYFAIFKIKIIKLAISRPRHYLGHHL
jgi:hypothetical protein